jgi:hypothetical protein
MGQKEIWKNIQTVADAMPVVTRIDHELEEVPGFVLINQGQYELPDGTKVLPGEIYIQEFPVILEVSHKQQLKNYYKKYGPDGLFMYINAVEKYLQELNKEDEENKKGQGKNPNRLKTFFTSMNKLFMNEYLATKVKTFFSINQIS